LQAPCFAFRFAFLTSSSDTSDEERSVGGDLELELEEEEPATDQARYREVTLPTVTIPWDDDILHARVSQATVLLSGMDGTTGVEASVNDDSRSTSIIINTTQATMWNTELYNSHFTKTDSNGHDMRRYEQGHSKITAMRDAIKEMKGTSSSNQMVFVHRQPLPGPQVKKEFVKVGGYGGERYFKLGPRGDNNPEFVINLEMQAMEHGHLSTTGDYNAVV
jgi:hypothetical protein